jgi:hypothetical protein
MSASCPVSFHQPRTTCDSTRRPASIRYWIGRGEHVHADQGEVAGGQRRLLDEAHHATVLELGDPVVLGVSHRGQQDQRLGAAAAEALDELDDPALEQVVPEVHDERLAAEEALRGQHGMREAARTVLFDVGDPHAELRAIADRRANLAAGLGGDDDADLLDARRRDRLDPIEQDRLVGDRDELLGTGMGDRTQTGPPPTRKNQPLHPTATSLR